MTARLALSVSDVSAVPARCDCVNHGQAAFKFGGIKPGILKRGKLHPRAFWAAPANCGKMRGAFKAKALMVGFKFGCHFGVPLRSSTVNNLNTIGGIKICQNAAGGEYG